MRRARPSARSSAPAAAAALVAYWAALAACSGAPPPAASRAASADPSAPGARARGDGPSATAPRPGPRCDDGTCFACGDGFCPSGFACERAGGRQGCAWYSRCAAKPTCACVAATAPGCRCDEREGGVHVACD